jgi:hypothetical protein
MLNTTHDASILSDKYINTQNGMLFDENVPKFPLHKITVGTELVTLPLCIDDESWLLATIKDILVRVQEMGDMEKSFRASIHVHVCMPYNLQILKNIIRLGRFLEDVFFYIGGQGYEFRGAKVNDSLYCRPITMWGPPCVLVDSGKYAQVFDTYALLASRTVAEFWRRNGDIDFYNPPGSMNPARYVWLNVCSLLEHGTLEFRVFNKTHNPYYLYSEVLLCLAFCKYAMKASFSEIKDDGINIENSIFANREKGDIIKTLEHFGRLSSTNISEDVLDTLKMIIERTPKITLREGYVSTHRPSNGALWSHGNYSPTIVEGVRNGNVQDIHTLRGERRP